MNIGMLEAFQELPTPNKFIFETYQGFAAYVNDYKSSDGGYFGY